MTTKLAFNQINGNVVSVKDLGAVDDDATDSRAAFKAAIAKLSSGDTLLIDGGTYFLSVEPSQNYCVTLSGLSNIKIRGSGTVHMTDQTDKQIMRLDTCTNISVKGITFKGPANTGADGAQGLLQAVGCTNIEVEGVNVTDADADGIAISTSTGVRLTNNHSTNCKKAALYVNQSSDVVISNNVVRSFGGHTVSGSVVGGGILAASNDNTTITGNTVTNGTGQGIVVNAISGVAQPTNTTVVGNSVNTVSNATNTNVSGGIFLANSNANHACGTTVQGNAVAACGIYNYWIQNHDGLDVSNNVSIEAEQSSILISNCIGGQVSNNTLINTNTSNTASQHGLWFLNACDSIRARGNRILDLASFATSYGAHDVKNSATGADMDVFDIGRVIVKTADYTITDEDLAGDAPTTFTNEGAAGTITFTLPSAVTARDNVKLRFIRVTGQSLRVDPNGLEQFRGATAGKYLQLDANGDTVDLTTVTGNIWEKYSLVGTPSIEP